MAIVTDELEVTKKCKELCEVLEAKLLKSMVHLRLTKI